ncbi:MAG TPA: hypothetical protein PLF40_28480, partial [Kofleriaceae bacterium]|nr:hypothetical protein [Kofleriaceae bacterium]
MHFFDRNRTLLRSIFALLRVTTKRMQLGSVPHRVIQVTGATMTLLEKSRSNLPQDHSALPTQNA